MTRKPKEPSLAFWAMTLMGIACLLQTIALLARCAAPKPAKPPEPPCYTLTPQMRLVKARFADAATVEAGRDLATTIAPWVAFCLHDPAVEVELSLLATHRPNEQPEQTIASIITRLRAVEKD